MRNANIVEARDPVQAREWNGKWSGRGAAVIGCCSGHGIRGADNDSGNNFVHMRKEIGQKLFSGTVRNELKFVCRECDTKIW